MALAPSETCSHMEQQFWAKHARIAQVIHSAGGEMFLRWQETWRQGTYTRSYTIRSLLSTLNPVTMCVCDWWSNHIQLWSWDPAQYAGPETDETNDETIKMVSMMFHLKGLKDTTSPKHSKTVYTSFPVDQISFGSDLVVFTWRTKNPGRFPSASQDSAFPCSQRSQPVEYDCFSPQSTAERCHRLHYGYPMLSSKPNELRFFPKLQYTNWIKLGPLPGAYANHSSDAKLPTRGLPFKKCLRGCLRESCCSDLFTWRDEVTILVQKRIVRWIGRWRFFGWLVKGRRKLHAWSTKGHVIGSHDELMETFGWATRENFMVAR